MEKEKLVEMGLTEEQAEKVIKLHKGIVDGNFVPKSRFNEVNDAKNSLDKQLKERDKQLEDLKKSSGDNEELKNQIANLQKENSEVKKQHEAELKELRLSNAIKVSLAGKVYDEDMAAACFDKSKLILSEDGKVHGLEEQLKSLQENKGFLFKQEQRESHYIPNKGGTLKKNPFLKDSFNLTEQGKLLKENPVQARELAAAAGVTI